MLRNIAIGFVCGMTATALHAQTLLSDIHSSRFRSFDHPADLTVSGTKLFFRSVNESGFELWCSDGNPGNESIPRDIRPGGPSARPESITDLDGAGRVVFTAYVPDTGREPWVSDGTFAGTFALGDLLPGESTSTPIGMVRVGNNVFFSADDGVHGRELWITDGTAGGTQLVVDLAPGASAGWLGTSEAPGVALGSALVFAATDGSSGAELWISNGSAAGTLPVVDLDPFGTATIERLDPSTDPVRVWVTATDSSGGVTIFSTDGTSAGTQPFVDVTTLTGGAVDTATDIGGDLYFTSNGALYRTEFATGTTTQILDASNGSCADPIGVGAWVLFQAGRALWRTDGTAANTREVSPTSGTTFRLDSLEDRVVVGSRIYFPGGTGSLSRVWVSDGTDAGTRLVDEVCSACSASPEYFVEWNGRAACALQPSSTAFREVWITDGTTFGTSQVTFIASSTGNGSFPENFTTLRDRAYFTVSRSPFGRELFTTDGTPSGTFLLEDLRNGTANSSPDAPFAWNDGLFFFASGDAGNGLYRSSGVPVGGTAAPPAVRLTPAWVWSNFVPFQGKLSFSGGQNGAGEVELWSTDGSVAGTQRAIDVVPGPDASFPSELAVVGGQLFFAANDPQLGSELWVTDGTQAGTRVVYDLWPGAFFGRPGDMHELNGGLLFTAQAGETMRSLWWSDGTTAGTIQLAQFEGNSNFDQIDSIYIDGNRALFRASDVSGGTELWKTDGTIAGTQRVIDLEPGPDGSRPTIFGRVGDKILFSARRAQNGFELFATDGTAQGTTLVADIWPGPDDSAPQNGFVVGAGNRMLFSAFCPNGEGNEPWVTDGTALGTRRLVDLYVGLPGSVPAAWARLGTKVVFRATTAAFGHEPMVLDTDSIDAALADSYGDGCPGANGVTPVLAAARAPTLGANDVLTLDDVPPSTSAVVALGLRADLPIGFGCSLLIDPIIAQIVVTTAATGPTVVPLSIPNVPVLLHFEFSAQPLVLDPLGSWLNLVSFGNGLTLRIGG